MSPRPDPASLVVGLPPRERRGGTDARLIAERLDDVTRLVSDWIWETDEALVVTYVSHRLVEATGYHPREILGRPLTELGRFVQSDDEPPVLTPQRRTPFRDQPFEMLHRDGSPRLFHVSSLPMFCAETGAFHGFRGSARDVTELVRRERDLIAAKEEAEIASRSKSVFLANTSHELRTPLNAIIGFSEIMRDEIFGPIGSPQYKEYLADVLDSAQHLLKLINEILDLAKAEAGKLELVEEEVDVGATIRAAVRLMRERAQRGGLEIGVAIDPELPTAYADERKLKQILLNLLSNAVKFTPPGGNIEVSAAVDLSGDLVLAVRDSGVGIAEANIGVALAAFGQIEGSFSRKHAGTGLGLPLSRAMAELHGGALSIESTVGCGTTVRVRLPAERLRA